MRRTIGMSFAALLLLTAVSAHASLFIWTLQNVTFDDGGIATGSFMLDPTNTNQPVNFNITTAGEISPPHSYTQA